MNICAHPEVTRGRLFRCILFPSFFRIENQSEWIESNIFNRQPIFSIKSQNSKEQISFYVISRIFTSAQLEKESSMIECKGEK